MSPAPPPVAAPLPEGEKRVVRAPPVAAPSLYAAKFYLQNVNIFAAAGIKVGFHLPGGGECVVRAPSGRSAVAGGRGARRLRPPRRSAVAGRRGACHPRPSRPPSAGGGERVVRAPPGRSAVDGGRGARRSRPPPSQRRRRRERSASFSPPPSQRHPWREGSAFSAPFPTSPRADRRRRPRRAR